MSFELPGGNGRDSGIAGWENMGMGIQFQMGMGMKSLKWEGIGTKNLFPHTSRKETEKLGGLDPNVGGLDPHNVWDGSTPKHKNTTQCALTTNS